MRKFIVLISCLPIFLLSFEPLLAAGCDASESSHRSSSSSGCDGMKDSEAQTVHLDFEAMSNTNCIVCILNICRGESVFIKKQFLISDDKSRDYISQSDLKSIKLLRQSMPAIGFANAPRFILLSIYKNIQAYLLVFLN